MSKDDFDPRFDAAFQPGFDGKAAKSKPARAARTVSPAQAALESAREHAEVASAESSDDDEQESRRPNPFLVALGALSVLLIAGGVASQQWIRAQFLQEDIRLDLDYFSLDALKIAIPLSIALGVAIGAGLLFVLAIRWKKSD
jgi:hypothetical protein